jgi:hypothetical protein
VGAAGSYALRTVDGSPLPYGLGGGRSVTFHVVSARLELRSDGTFERTAAVSAMPAGSPVLEAPGTYRTGGHWTISGRVVTTQDSASGAGWPQILPRVRYALVGGRTLTAQPGDDTDHRVYLYERE